MSLKPFLVVGAILLAAAVLVGWVPAAVAYFGAFLLLGLAFFVP